MSTASPLDERQPAVTVLRASLDRIQLNGSVSNNPWNVTVSASLDSFGVESLQKYGSNEDDEEACDFDDVLVYPPGTAVSLRSLLSLPRIVARMQLSQTSTMARKIDGLLDWTCFDYTASVSMFPFSMSFRPQSFGSGIMGSTWANVWKASSPLSHLFLKRANWSKGT
mmetsp:Transcript_13655/g.18496  ORF Transcript_13655/g.18496 Transcript_13655/m.18496 type:complete len:168 (-) Transcript_13655:209-712(-)